MMPTLPIALILAAGMFLIGAIVGSFLNLCIARLPWEQSVFWPRSRCDSCGAEVKGLDLIPILGLLRLKGRARCCGSPISLRYPMVEFLTAVLFVLVYVIDTLTIARSTTNGFTLWVAITAHASCMALLVVVSFIDFDLTIVPAPVTNLGMFLGLFAGLIAPGYRAAPSNASTSIEGLVVGLIGLAVGAGLVWVIRVIGGLVFRREAMGSGDVHILGMVGAFLGWRIAVLSFFLSSFYGLIPSVWKLVSYLRKRATGREWNASDREIPLGPFLALAAATLYLAWFWVWPGFLKPRFLMVESILGLLPGEDVEN